jgi:hypothetical protein
MTQTTKVAPRRSSGGAPHARSACCTDHACPRLQAGNPEVPVWTVDEDIYREKPSLLLGTIDKFAQLARKFEQVRGFFGEKGTDGVSPPDLSTPDELHLISGPWGPSRPCTRLPSTSSVPASTRVTNHARR